MLALMQAMRRELKFGAVVGKEEPAVIAYCILLCFAPDLCPQSALRQLASKLVLAPPGQYKFCRWSHIIRRHQKAIEGTSLHALLHTCISCAQLQMLT